MLDKILIDTSAQELRVLLDVQDKEIKNTNFCGLSSVKIIEAVALSTSKRSDQDRIEFLTSVFRELKPYKVQVTLRDKVGASLYKELQKPGDNTFSFSSYL